MKTTGDQHLVKKINTSLVLETINRHAPLSRAKVAEMTKLNKGTVSNLVNELIENHLVYEIGTGESSGGRRPVMLLFNKEAGYAIGVDLGVDYILTVLANLHGEIVQDSTETLASKSFPSAMKQVKAAIEAMIKQAPPSPHGIVGIGVGVPGIVDEEGTVLFAPHLKWSDANVKRQLEAHFPYPVYVDNEANAGAIGEKKAGAGKDAANLVYISVGTGIGTGTIINGALFRGASGFSGEMGHMTIEAFGKPCSCGNRGCWELYASESALLELAEERLAVPEDANLDALLRKAEQGGAAAIELFEHIGRYLGIGIANIVNTFNPELIIVGNRMTKAERWLRPAIQNALDERALPFHRRHAALDFSRLGVRSCALGAADFAVAGFLAGIKVVVQ
ncbi:ROK family transcriptional regulator [Paenibacillus sp. MSJ-34]|uniref:ROK family transcriptional regulator n=1 Tax=Paenibacillus sp. MSJ-34 TaxID=2841529 RepID=UPI001C1149C8|nr:ROK family transcriptional regulator [Paenibacillus sp. MSJ-34]MBU5440713.1 ROK family transcriptional regulator [Paenibacillus sp. MSJ-34]